MQLGKAPHRKRKVWQFERLEERYLFTASPISQWQTQELSSLTPEGAAQIYAQELYWAALQSASSGDGSVSQVAATLNALPTDPLFSKQWHLFNTGQEVGNPDYQPIFAAPGEDLHLLGAWNLGYTGLGVIVGVTDSGVELNHDDLAVNISPTLRLDALTGDGDPSPDLIDPITNAHGTAVAGLIAAAANGMGGVGVAPGATIAPIRLIDVGQTDQAFIDNFVFAAQFLDISNNSWSPALVRQAAGPTPAMVDAIRQAIEFGRGGKGVIFVFSSGNDSSSPGIEGWQNNGNWDSANYNGFVNSRYTIGVSGIDHDGLYSNADGTITAYPESGTNVLVAAPTGSGATNIADDIGNGSGIVTSDLSGENGYNVAPLNGLELDHDFLTDTDAMSRFNGTSASAPMVSGVIALMLEANPELSWRDVKEILVRSARQAAQFEVPQTGSGLIGTNSWLVNQLSIFHDPDLYDPGNPMAMPPILPTDPFLAQFAPLTYLNPDAPASYTNGAGYTVSEGFGVYGDRYGFGHGVVDAEMAVKLALEWHDKHQELPDELTFTSAKYPAGTVPFNIPAAQIGNNDTGRILVPGGIGGIGGFINYWNEYYANNPFSGNNPPTNTRGASFIEFAVPPSNTMKIENVEVKVSIGGPAEDKEHLRILLVSPEGTFSELNPFYSDLNFTNFSRQNVGDWWNINTGSIDPDEGNFIWTFSTNRSWGERSDAAIQYDPTTGDPLASIFIDPVTGLPLTGSPVSSNWRVYIENWSNSAMSLNGIEVAWHGSRIDANSQRVQGFVGIDENQNVAFNFSRVIRQVLDENPLTARLGNVQNFQDLSQETFAPNVTLQAKRLSDGVIVATFVTGADGNYHFDLLPDDYEISVTEVDGVPIDQLVGVTLRNDTLTPPDFLKDFQQKWTITDEWFNAWDREDIDPSPFAQDLQVRLDANGVPTAYQPIFGYFADPNNPGSFLPFTGAATPSGMKNINFLLDVGPPPAAAVAFSGTVYADVNGDGQFNGDDVAAPGFQVFVDTNKSGQFDAADVIGFTDANGNYSLTAPATIADRFLVGVLPPSTDWVPTNPAGGTHTIIGFPGDSFTGINFAVRPTNGSGTAGNLDGSILGVVFQEKVNIGVPGVRDSFEQGIAGIRVFADDGDGTWEPGEAFDFTNANGAYFLADVGPGTVRVDVSVPDDWTMTVPAAGFKNVQLLSNGTATNVLFGLLNQAFNDLGDLADYPTTSGQNGPSHFIVPGFQLGARIDGEVTVVPTPDADADNLNGTNDEDGVVIVSNGGLMEVGANTLRVTVSGVGGYLNGWIDWNDDGDWDDEFEQVFTNRLLTEGPGGTPASHNLSVTAPLDMSGGPLAARFRWGSANNGYVGDDVVGEVEDYRLANELPPPVIILAAGDYDGSGLVDQNDYLLWKSTFGATTGDLRADGNGNGKVDAADYTIWRNNKGATSSIGSGAALASGTSSGVTLSESYLEGIRSQARSRAMSIYVPTLGGGTSSALASSSSAAQLQALKDQTVAVEVGGQSRTVRYFAGGGAGSSQSLAAGSTGSNVGPSLMALNGLQFSTVFSPKSSTTVLASQSNALSQSQDAINLQLLDDIWSTENLAGNDSELERPTESDEAVDHDVTGLAMAALFDHGGRLSDGV